MSGPFDQFQYWLVDMDDALDRFIATVPAGRAASLDSSPASLDVLESLILSDYPSVAHAKAPGEAVRIDGYARYLGEVLRRHFGGRWKIELDDERNAFSACPSSSAWQASRCSSAP